MFPNAPHPLSPAASRTLQRLFVLCLGVLITLVLFVHQRASVAANQRQSLHTQPRVCSHRALGLGDLEDEATPIMERIEQLVARGVTCFDLDLYVASDGEVVVGRPQESVEEVEHKTSVEIMSRNKINVATWERFIEWVKERKDAIDWVTVEPKGSLGEFAGAECSTSSIEPTSPPPSFLPSQGNPPGGICILAAAISAHPATLDRIILISDNREFAQKSRIEFPNLKLACTLSQREYTNVSMRDYAMCIPGREPKSNFDNYFMLMPSVVSVGMCTDVVKRAQENGLKVSVWMVDTVRDMDTIRGFMTVNGVISNIPFSLR